jgi:iron(II)-dependent oxidoreductase
VNAPYDLPITRATPRDLAAALRQSYATTLRLVGDFEEKQWIGPYLPVVNPPLWETGHLAWFLERWVLRRGGAAPLLADADALYDSSRIAHVARWFLPLPPPGETLAYLARTTNAALQRLDSGGIAEPAGLYYVELSLYHQDMHNEAFRYMRQTWGLRDPLAQGSPAPQASDGARGDAQIPAGRATLGAGRDEGFVFDNEKWAHEVEVPAFRIARRAVSSGEFLAFVEDGGYLRREFWDDAAWCWRVEGGRRAPRYWRRTAQGWQQQVFGRWQALTTGLPVMHVSAWEAEAYCRWAGRRLPSEAEWVRAAATAPGETRMRPHPWGEAAPDAVRANLDGAAPLDVSACPAGDSGWGCRQMLGNVWEWTGTVFQPFPGFAPDPYEDYSRPWFGSHRVLRGGSFATHPRIARLGYRNYFTPDRNDLFSGFRTCAL